jgi:hypothetical protein
MENQEIEWAQFKARIPRKLHRDAKIACATLDRKMVDVCVEALEKVIAEARYKKIDGILNQ